VKPLLLGPFQPRGISTGCMVLMGRTTCLSNIYIGHHLPSPFNHRSLHHRCFKRLPAKHLHRPLLLTRPLLALVPNPFLYYMYLLFLSFNNIILTCLEQEKTNSDIYYFSLPLLLKHVNSNIETMTLRERKMGLLYTCLAYQSKWLQSCYNFEKHESTMSKFLGGYSRTNKNTGKNRELLGKDTGDQVNTQSQGIPLCTETTFKAAA
jgi:hypothetical protein